MQPTLNRRDSDTFPKFDLYQVECNPTHQNLYSGHQESLQISAIDPELLETSHERVNSRENSLEPKIIRNHNHQSRNKLSRQAKSTNKVGAARSHNSSTMFSSNSFIKRGVSKTMLSQQEQSSIDREEKTEKTEKTYVSFTGLKVSKVNKIIQKKKNERKSVDKVQQESKLIQGIGATKKDNMLF